MICFWFLLVWPLGSVAALGSVACSEPLIFGREEILFWCCACPPELQGARCHGPPARPHPPEPELLLSVRRAANGSRTRRKEAELQSRRGHFENIFSALHFEWAPSTGKQEKNRLLDYPQLKLLSCLRRWLKCEGNLWKIIDVSFGELSVCTVCTV